MKKNILLLPAFFFIWLSAMSQNSFGLKAGINLAHQTTISNSTIFQHPTLQTKALFGYQFGVFYKAKISKKLAFSTEANFSVIGGKDQYLFPPLNGDTAFIVKYVNDKIGYIEVPLIIQYDLNNRFYVSAGPALSFKLFTKSALPNTTLDYNSFDAAGKLLGGCKIFQEWEVNLSYSYGLTNINKDSNGESKRKNRYFNLSLLYALK